MSNSDEEEIFKDLKYTQDAYYSGEQIFPLWENIYAVIVSAFLIAYFTSDHIGFSQKVILILIGLIFSVCWLQLVSRNHLNSQARWVRLKKLEKALQKTIQSAEGTRPLTLFTLSDDEQAFISSQKSYSSLFRTWSLRKLVPMSLTFIWLIMLLICISTNIGK